MIVEAGVVTSLLSIKEIRRAIGRLISGMVDVPHAYLERWSEGIRDDTAARKTVTATIASAALNLAKEDSALIERGLERWTRQIGDKQRARENIAICTLSVLAEGEMPQNTAAPSEDFMRAFEDMAEKVSAIELIDLMARILAGEIRKPGSVSRRTLAILPVLDQEIVGTLAKVSPYLLDGAWVHVPPSGAGEWRQRFALLSSVSISSEVSVRSLSERDGFSVARVGTNAVLMAVRPSKGAWFVDGAHLTPIGRELVSLLPLPTETKIEEIALGFKEHTFVEQVSIGEIVDEGGAFKVINAHEVMVSPTTPE